MSGQNSEIRKSLILQEIKILDFWKKVLTKNLSFFSTLFTQKTHEFRGFAPDFKKQKTYKK